MNKPTIFCFNPGDWHLPWWVDRQHLLWRLAARGWPVIYSSGPLNVWDRNSVEWLSAPLSTSFEEIPTDGEFSVSVAHAGKLFPLWPKSERWCKLVHKKHADELIKFAGNPPPEQRIALMCYPTYLPYIDLLEANRVVLHVFDAWSDNKGWEEEHGANMAKLVERTDLITALSASMARILPGSGPDRAKVLPHGVDAQFIASGEQSACPPDLAKIPEPRIGHFGRVSQKVDLELIVNLAKRRPDWNWVFVGTTVGLIKGSADALAWQECHHLANVHILGHKPDAEVPAYMCHVNVNVLPFKSKGKGYWNSIFSMKTYEYLATGKPVVGSDIENIRSHSHVITPAASEDEWEKALEYSITQGGVGTKEERIKLAFENSWDDRADKLDLWLKKISGIR